MNKTILIVDDEADYLELLQEILEGYSWDVTTAISGKKALQLIEAKSFDCILSDINMPEIDGLELICKVRISQLNRTSIVIAMSGLYNKEEVDQKADFTISSFIGKPFDYNVFIEEYEKMSKQKEKNSQIEIDHDQNLIEDHD